MKKCTLLLVLALLFTQKLYAQFSAVANLHPLPITANTREKPQSKVWQHDNKHWTLLSDSSGAHVWRLDANATWTKILTVSKSTNHRADCKVAGNLVHILLYRDIRTDLVSIEYDPANSTYQLWTGRPSTIRIPLDAFSETATIDLDTNGRMWLASDSDSSITVRWSDSPYSSWSAPIDVATRVTPDDIGAVIAFPGTGKIGVFWSNQNTRRFGFKLHTDGTNPALWSSDELPASQSALNVGGGMADDHMNLKLGSDGTLYCAVKTSYDTPGYPKISLLVRRPNGIWDNLYGISEIGTRGIVVLNEQVGKLRVVYASSEDNGDILYKETAIPVITFGQQQTLISGVYNNPTCIKNSFKDQVAIVASSNTSAVSVLVTDIETPTLALPADNATGISITPGLSWNTAFNATSYQVQVATSSTFNTLVADVNNITTLSATINGLNYSTQYFWRVRAVNAAGAGNWSSARSFTTEAPPASTPGTPILVSPANSATGVTVNPVLSWDAASNATSYQLQVATSNTFITLVYNQSNIAALSQQLTGLSNNTQYYWRVKAFNGTIESNWSSVQSFLTESALPPLPGVPTLVSPANNANNISIYPTLSWNAASNAATYQLQLATSTTFTNPVADITGISGTSKSVLGLAYSTQHYWRVRAVNSAGAGGWSAVRTFKTLALPAPGTPNLVSPANNASGIAVSPTLTWSAAANAATYQVQLSSNNKFKTILADFSNVNGLSVSVSGLAHSTQYFWRVRAVNATGISNWSSVWKFTTAASSARQSGRESTQDEPAISDEFSPNVSKVALTTGIAANLQEQPELTALPNAFRTSTNINFTIPCSGEYSLILYNTAGQQIRVLKKGFAKAGEKYTVNLHSPELPKGLYLIRLQTNVSSAVLKILRE